MIPQHSSATNEHPTPSFIVEPARTLLGGFELDPASLPVWNEQIKAERIFTEAEDGLTKEWNARTVFLNPPGGKLKRSPLDGRWLQVKGGRSESSMRVWWAHLVEEWFARRVGAAFFVGFTLEILRTSQKDCRLPVQAFPRCYPKDRIAFQGDDPTHANVLVWLPDCHRGPSPWFLGHEMLQEHFGHIGHCEPGYR